LASYLDSRHPSSKGLIAIKKINKCFTGEKDKV